MHRRLEVRLPRVREAELPLRAREGLLALAVDLLLVLEGRAAGPGLGQVEVARAPVVEAVAAPEVRVRAEAVDLAALEGDLLLLALLDELDRKSVV